MKVIDRLEKDSPYWAGLIKFFIFVLKVVFFPWGAVCLHLQIIRPLQEKIKQLEKENYRLKLVVESKRRWSKEENVIRLFSRKDDENEC